jgi:hypothetical protein
MEIAAPGKESVIDATNVINVLINVLNKSASQFEFLKSNGFEITQSPTHKTITITGGCERNDMNARGIIFKIKNPLIGIEVHVEILNGISITTNSGSFSILSPVSTGFTLDSEFFNDSAPKKIVYLAFKLVNYMHEHPAFYNIPEKILVVPALLIAGLEPKWFSKNQLDKIKRYFPGIAMNKFEIINDEDRQRFIETIRKTTFGTLVILPDKKKEGGANTKDLFEKLQMKAVDVNDLLEELKKLQKEEADANDLLEKLQREHEERQEQIRNDYLFALNISNP